MEKNNSISNKEALRDKIHEIHNFLRNNGAGYGMNALKVFNIFYGLKKIEENNLLDKVNLKRPECEFSYLLKLANEGFNEETLCDLIFRNVLDSISQSNIRYILFYEIPRNIRGSVFEFLIKEIDKITVIEKTCNVLLSGKIYEYFIGRDESAISELGAYFTDRHIVDFIFNKLNPSINSDNTINEMIDMFGGSGGFTTGYINYLNNKYSNKINWNTELDKIYHYDMNEDVIKSAGLEFFCLTGVLPKKDNLEYRNSFTSDFGDPNTNTYKKYKYVITNPPYGGDNTNKSSSQKKRDKIKDYIKNELLTIKDDKLKEKRLLQLKNIEIQEKQDKKDSDKNKVCLSSCSNRINKFAKKYNLKGNDKESCSLILLMDVLEEDGTSIGVLKEGVFFNKTYKDLRKCLIENFNVREIISIPSDQFENTSTKTSIVIFDNTKEKTKEVKFSDLLIERYKEDKYEEILDNIVITENKDDIKEIKDNLISIATKEEILNNPIYSLNGKDYNKKEIRCGEEYKLIRLGDICEIQNGNRIVKDKAEKGIYPCYGGGDISFYTNKYTREGKTCKISREGMSLDNCVMILNEKYYLNSQGLTIISKYTNILNEYVWYYLLCNKELIYNCGRGTIQKAIDINQFNNLQIPIPKNDKKIIEWVDKINKPYNEKNEKELKIKELELYIQNRIKEINENEECNYEELGNICNIQNGTRIVKKNIIEGIYPCYGGGDISFYINNYNREGFNIIISRFAISEKCVRLLNDKFYLNDSGLTISSKNEININNKYLGYYLLNNQINIYNNSRGSIQKNLDIQQFKKIKISIPKNKQLIDDLDTTFNEIEKLKKEVKEADELYKKLIKELGEEAIIN